MNFLFVVDITPQHISNGWYDDVLKYNLYGNSIMFLTHKLVEATNKFLIY